MHVNKKKTSIMACEICYNLSIVVLSQLLLILRLLYEMYGRCQKGGDVSQFDEL